MRQAERNTNVSGFFNLFITFYFVNETIGSTEFGFRCIYRPTIRLARIPGTFNEKSIEKITSDQSYETIYRRIGRF